MSAAHRPRLEVVPDTSAEFIDIYAADKAKIASIDWAAVHVRGDRAEAISMPERMRKVVRW